MSAFPISEPYELGRLSQAGDEVVISPSAEMRARLAHWAGVDSVEAFEATVELRKVTPTRFSLEATLKADIVQSCVVTLDPVRTHIETSFRRELLLAERRPSDGEPAPVDEDGREEIESLRYDLAVPVLEELALQIDPYPRRPGVQFEPPMDVTDRPDHPFAALKKLKD